MVDIDIASPTPLRVLPPPTHLRPVLWSGFQELLPPLIGREREVAALVALLQHPSRRLVTITGPGGIGKTRLAIAVAEATATAFLDGVVFVPLAALRDPAQVLSAIARALDVREMTGPVTVEGLSTALKGRHLLLVLDNLEHVLPATQDLDALIAHCPQLLVLVTSREPPRLPYEERFATPPLTLPPADPEQDLDLTRMAESEAVAFFVDRARWAAPDFSLDAGNAGTIAEMCRRLDGLPLAIELAAAWMHVLTPAMLLQRLERRLPLLRGGSEHRPDRLRTMHNAIAWSYDLLTPDEARLFRALSIFAGGCTLEAAEAVSAAVCLPGCAPPLDLLASLIDKNLLQTQVNDRFSRFLMLETVREFAREQLEASGEATAVAAAHAAWVVSFVEGAEPHLLGPDEREWLRRSEAELDNIRAALTWSLDHDVESALRIGAALWVTFHWYLAAEGAEWLRRALARATSEPVRVRARASITHAALAGLSGDPTACMTAAQCATRLAPEAGDPIDEGAALWVLGCAEMLAGHVTIATHHLDSALPLLEQAATSTKRALLAHAWSHRGVAAFAAGDMATGLACYERAREEVRMAHSDCMSMIVLGDYAGWLTDLGEFERARDLALETLAIARGHPSYMVASPLSCLALLSALRGEMEQAARFLGAIEEVWRHCGIDIPLHFRGRLDRAELLARDALSDAAFGAALTEGQQSLAAILTGPKNDAANSIPAGDPASPLSDLTPRQREVVSLLVAGYTDRQIAQSLFISHRTVSSHVAVIMDKLQARTRGEAAFRAVRAGLI